MKILLPYYSRSGHTEQLALVLARELQARGHSVTLEKIRVESERSKWRLALPLLSTLPLLPLFLGSANFRRWWLQRYPQAQQAIEPLAHPDVSEFDCLCIGGPKWLYVAYPIARYLQQIRGMEGKPVGAFATFCGPPLAVFELEMLFSPLGHRIESRGGRMISSLAISSHFHEFFFFNEMEFVFRLISRLAFKRPLRTFGLSSPWGQDEVARFCDALCKQQLDRSGPCAGIEN
ncbi:hypothetical protein BH11PSE11_BH11PSE11_19820 [soil metagenome]